MLGALAWCFAIVLLSAKLGLSTAMGALIAGVSLSTFPYNLDVIAKVVSLRDFFITLFFVSLGTKIQQPTMDVVRDRARRIGVRHRVALPDHHADPRRVREGQPGELHRPGSTSAR